MSNELTEQDKEEIILLKGQLQEKCVEHFKDKKSHYDDNHGAESITDFLMFWINQVPEPTDKDTMPSRKDLMLMAICKAEIKYIRMLCLSANKDIQPAINKVVNRIADEIKSSVIDFDAGVLTKEQVDIDCKKHAFLILKAEALLGIKILDEALTR
jgi:hypothetical protein